MGLIGIGSLNTEELARINSSGQFGAYYVPFIKPVQGCSNLFFKNTFYVSYNINATNNDDSLLASTVLLPALGNSSFTGSIESGIIYIDDKARTRYNASLLFEFSTKHIRVDNEDTVVHFNTLNYTFGIKLVSTYSLPVAGNDIPFSFSLVPYIHWLNVPDEDYADYRYLLEDSNLPTRLKGIGCKAIVALHNFQFFADLRHTFDNHNRDHQLGYEGIYFQHRRYSSCTFRVLTDLSVT